MTADCSMAAGFDHLSDGLLVLNGHQVFRNQPASQTVLWAEIIPLSAPKQDGPRPPVLAAVPVLRPQRTGQPLQSMVPDSDDTGRLNTIRQLLEMLR